MFGKSVILEELAAKGRRLSDHVITAPIEDGKMLEKISIRGEGPIRAGTSRRRPGHLRRVLRRSRTAAPRCRAVQAGAVNFMAAGLLLSPKADP